MRLNCFERDLNKTVGGIFKSVLGSTAVGDTSCGPRVGATVGSAVGCGFATAVAPSSPSNAARQYRCHEREASVRDRKWGIDSGVGSAASASMGFAEFEDLSRWGKA